MKYYKNILIVSLFIIFSFTALAQTKVISSSWSVNQTLAAYSLDNNNGERVMTIDVDFDTPFKDKPQIFLSVTQIDAAKESNVRYNVESISISRDGFTIKVRTWADSKIFSISGYWIAYSK